MALVALRSAARACLVALRVYRDLKAQRRDGPAEQLFGYSILYLFLLFAALLADTTAGPVSADRWTRRMNEANGVVMTEERSSDGAPGPIGDGARARRARVCCSTPSPSPSSACVLERSL